MLITIAGGLAALLYLAAAGIILHDFHRQQVVERRWVVPTALLAVLVHGVIIGLTTPMDGGLNLSFYNALSLVGWLVVALFLAANIKRPLDSLGIVIYPFSAVLVLLQVLLGGQRMTPVSFDWQMDIHVATAVFAFAILSIGAAQAVLLAVQERALRNHRFGGVVVVLPPMDAMERLLFQLIGLGFALLTLTLITGLVFVDDLMGQSLVHKTVLSIIGWIVFATLLWGRWRHGWRGRTAIRMTLAGMAVLLLSYFGSKLVIELILGRTG